MNHHLNLVLLVDCLRESPRLMHLNLAQTRGAKAPNLRVQFRYYLTPKQDRSYFLVHFRLPNLISHRQNLPTSFYSNLYLLYRREIAYL